MVIFIINIETAGFKLDALFTFQYGYIYYTGMAGASASQTRFTFQYGYIYYQILKDFANSDAFIYIPIWLYLLLAIEALNTINALAFTFQYGYIYYL